MNVLTERYYIFNEPEKNLEEAGHSFLACPE
jgi:hypothetical protein